MCEEVGGYEIRMNIVTQLVYVERGGLEQQPAHLQQELINSTSELRIALFLPRINN